ncbi:hypothetical protein GCM10025778_31180 [Paeniglutamicibacter antarcticus]|uniref:EcsC family protein n=1 Tax=Paeniglutamicibacter antarcticus TaxID=494023 RepID=A0ABP9TUF1_9MICC
MTCTVSDENDKSIELIVMPDLGIPVEVDSDGPRPEDGTNPSIKAMMDEQDGEAVQFAISFLKKVIRLRGVRIDRAQFLKSELHKRGIGAADIDRAISENPAVAGITPAMLDEIADSAIDFETAKSSALSFAAGLPGGIAMIGTVPADITQFYVHAFRVMQKIAYIYGWQSFLKDIEDIDDETLGILATFLGVMMGVGSASASLGAFAVQIARPAVQKKIASVALTKTAWYLPMKQTLKVIGVQVTKQSFAKTMSKVVPVVGGVVSGSLTFVTLNTQSKRLMKHLRELPPPNVDAEAYLAAVKLADEMAPSSTKDLVARLGDVNSTVKETASSAAEILGTGVASAAGTVTRPFRSVDIDGDGIPDEPQALTKVKGVGGVIAGKASSVGGSVAGLFKSKKHGEQTDDDSVISRSEAVEQ